MVRATKKNTVLKKVLLLFCIMLTQALSQERILVSPQGEIIPLAKDQSAYRTALEKSSSPNVNCENYGTFGYPPYLFPPVLPEPPVDITGYPLSHKQVLAILFVPPSNGTLDSIYWLIMPSYLGEVHTIPMTIRIFRATIDAKKGFGTVINNNFLPWGYFINTNDIDQGITGYHDEATNPQWICTNQDSTWDPLGEELWGYGGFYIPMRMDAGIHIHGIDFYDIFGEDPILKKDDPIFICFRNEGQHVDDYTQALLFGYPYSSDFSKPWKVWKFFEHEQSFRPRGWVAMNSGSPNIWYTMKLNYPPPTIVPLPEVIQSGTKEGEEIKLNLMKFCKPEYLDSVGIDNIWLDYQFDYNPPDSVQPVVVGDTMLQVILPPQESATKVKLHFRAIDSTGYALYAFDVNFRVFGLVQNGYRADTSCTFDWVNTSVYGEELSYDKLFLRPGYFGFPLDDGTAGPIDIGFTFTFFGTPVRYAWIGVNGGLAFSDSPLDTQHLNGVSAFVNWIIPNSQVQPTGMSKNFVAPLWADMHMLSMWFNCDSGRIYYAYEPNRFIVEWFELTNYLNDTDCVSNYQVIIDQNDTSITFQYKNIGFSGLERISTIGFEADTTKWFSLCDRGTPESTRPRNNSAVKFKFVTPVDVKEDNPKIPTAYLLEQNYPNPFNSTTSIRYHIPKAGWVTLKIYNALGDEIATLVNRYESPGIKSCQWDAKDIGSGIYIYRMVAGSYNETRKMALIK